MQTVSGYLNLIEQYIGQNTLYILIIAAWLVFISRLKLRKRRITITFIIILILTVYNPLSYQILIKLTEETATYYRFLWILPAHIMLTYFVYGEIQEIHHLKIQLITVCIICIGMFYIIIPKEDLLLPENASQIPLDTLEVAMQLDSLITENKKNKIKIIADQHICHTLRQYDSRICYLVEPLTETLDPELTEASGFGIMSMLMYNRNDIPPEIVNSILNTGEIDFLIVSISNDISLDYMQQINWQITATTSAYCILEYQESTF